MAQTTRLLFIAAIISVVNSDSVSLIRSFLQDSSNKSNECVSSLETLINEFGKNSSYANIMVHSLDPRPADVTKGQLSADFGDFDACLSIDGKYCLYRQHYDTTRHEVPRDLRDFLKFETTAASVCLPKECSDEEIIRFLEQYVAESGSRIVVKSGCETQERIAKGFHTELETFMSVSLLLWTLFVILSSVAFEVRPTNAFLRCFSIRQNVL